MGVTRKVLKQGNNIDKPKKGDEVTIEYTGCLYDKKQEHNEYRGTKYLGLIKEDAKAMPIARFDSSIGRGDFKTPIGVGKVIKGKVTKPPSTCLEHSI
ncbi:MAG: hypothetical protein M1830_002279 [Pleopsidium flavum]|nr:MAG: hypothetical protein M1830_002279 [Pleopsidium flavum]